MSLILSGLQSDLEDVFTGSPATANDAAIAWVAAINSYFSGVVPASTSVSLASLSLRVALLAAFSSSGSSPGDFASPMESAFTAFATTVGGGMAGFVATPPQGPVGFSSLLGSNKADAETSAADWAAAIDTWARTGLAQVAGGPPPPPVNWS